LNKNILQIWRSADFSPGDKDSILEVILGKAEKGTKIILLHKNVPDGQGVGYKKTGKNFILNP
jgi:hypothetical protein